MLHKKFFARDAAVVAQALLGKVIRVKYSANIWLAASIIETEAYYLHDKASHASLGYTAKRKALFMPPGTIYMYYSRGGDSLNVSCLGAGDAALIKAGYPYLQDLNEEAACKMLEIMQYLCAHNAINRINKVNKTSRTSGEKNTTNSATNKTINSATNNVKNNIKNSAKKNNDAHSVIAVNI